MSPVVLTFTLILLVLPIGFYVAALAGAGFHTAPCFIVIAFYMWIWLRFRPTRFVMHKQSLEVIWPLKRQEIPLHSISSVRLLDREMLKQEIGWGLRLGAGGLGGGCGWLWTKRHGLVQRYIPRTDGFVWVERKSDRPWLLTPEQPEAFILALSN
jgi:Bacterial PH domain